MFASSPWNAIHVGCDPYFGQPMTTQRLMFPEQCSLFFLSCKATAANVSSTVLLLVQVRKLAPKHMQEDEAGCAARHAHVTCANFSRQGEIVATYNDEVSPVCIREQCSEQLMSCESLPCNRKWSKLVDMIYLSRCFMSLECSQGLLKQGACCMQQTRCMHCVLGSVLRRNARLLCTSVFAIHRASGMLLQKIYLFAPEGSTQDRGRPRPPSASIASPAKRAKTGSLDDEEQQAQQIDADELEDEEQQATEAEDMAAERSSTSKLFSAAWNKYEHKKILFAVDVQLASFDQGEFRSVCLLVPQQQLLLKLLACTPTEGTVLNTFFCAAT